MLDLGEKRKHPRLAIRVPLKYKNLRIDNPSYKGALTENISEGGVKFSVERFVSLSGRMVIELNLPSISKPLRMISKVAWIRKLPSGDNYEIGNQFLDMAKEDKTAISEFVKTRHQTPA